VDPQNLGESPKAHVPYRPMMEARSRVGVPPLRRLAITVRGVVQGVGFRPFVYNAARARGLVGWVRNEADVVRIEVQGEPAALDAFVDTVRTFIA